MIKEFTNILEAKKANFGIDENTGDLRILIYLEDGSNYDEICQYQNLDTIAELIEGLLDGAKNYRIVIEDANYDELIIDAEKKLYQTLLYEYETAYNKNQSIKEFCGKNRMIHCSSKVKYLFLKEFNRKMIVTYSKR